MQCEYLIHRRWRLVCWRAEPFFSRTRKLPCIFAALFVCYSSRLRLRDSLLRPCYDFLLFFTTQTRPVHRETDSGDEKFITPINKIHNPILGYGYICSVSPSNVKFNIPIHSRRRRRSSRRLPHGTPCKDCKQNTVSICGFI